MIYFILCFIWSLFAGYKQRTSYKVPFNCWKNVIITGIVNFIIFPYAFYLALKKQKI